MWDLLLNLTGIYVVSRFMYLQTNKLVLMQKFCLFPFQEFSQTFLVLNFHEHKRVWIRYFDAFTSVQQKSRLKMESKSFNSPNLYWHLIVLSTFIHSVSFWLESDKAAIVVSQTKQLIIINCNVCCQHETFKERW